MAFTQEAIAELNRQDASATVIAQRNLTSATAVPGQLNEREEALVHFYRYLADRLTNDATPAGHAGDP